MSWPMKVKKCAKIARQQDKCLLSTFYKLVRNMYLDKQVRQEKKNRQIDRKIDIRVIDCQIDTCYLFKLKRKYVRYTVNP